AEAGIRDVLQAKWERHKKQLGKMAEIIREHGLASASKIKKLTVGMGIKREEATGQNWRLVNNDTVLETATMPDSSVKLIITSIPFCYDSETEVLTKRGWLSFGDLNETDEVATVNQHGLHFQWQQPT